MKTTDNTEILKALQRILLLFAEREHEIQKVLIDVQAVIEVTSKDHPQYVDVRDELRKNLKYDSASSLERALRQGADDIGTIIGP